MRSKKEEETPVPYKRDRTVQRPSKKDVKRVQFLHHLPLKKSY